MTTAVTNPGRWAVADEELGNVTVPRKPTKKRRVHAQESAQTSEAIAIGTLSPGLEAAVLAVLKLSAMKAGWDGYRSPAIGQAAIAGALNVLGMLEGLALPKPHVSPVAGGGIQIEWEKGDKELELEFARTGALAYLKADPAGEEEGALAPGHRHKLWTLLVWLSE
jgi:hypothetical protein